MGVEWKGLSGWERFKWVTMERFEWVGGVLLSEGWLDRLGGGGGGGGLSGWEWLGGWREKVW